MTESPKTGQCVFMYAVEDKQGANDPKPSISINGLTLVRVLREPKKHTVTSPSTNTSLLWDRKSGYSSMTAVMMASRPPNWTHTHSLHIQVLSQY